MALAALPKVSSIAVSARQVYLVDVDLIDLGERVRPIDRDWAEAIGTSMEGPQGQLTPIEIRPAGDRYVVVFGGHRLTGAQIKGRPQIEAYILADFDDLAARERQIIENLYRRELSALHRAAFVTELYEVEKARHGWEAGQSAQSFKISKRWAKDTSANIALVSGLSDSVAEKVGLSRRALFLDLSLHRSVNQAVSAALAARQIDAPAAQLRAIGKLDAVAQKRIAAQIEAGASVQDALKALSPAPQKSPEDKAFSAFIGAFGRMGLREKRAAMKALQGHLPAGIRIVFDGGDQ